MTEDGPKLPLNTRWPGLSGLYVLLFSMQLQSTASVVDIHILTAAISSGKFSHSQAAICWALVPQNLPRKARRMASCRCRPYSIGQSIDATDSDIQSLADILCTAVAEEQFPCLPHLEADQNFVPPERQHAVRNNTDVWAEKSRDTDKKPCDAAGRITIRAASNCEGGSLHLCVLV